MFNGHDLKRARSALLAIDPDCNREQWVDAGMAAKAAGLSFEDFDSWSAQSPKYNERDARTTWNSFSANGGIGPGTLFYLASDAGWREGAGQNRTGNANRSPQEPLKAPPKGMSAAEIWDRLELATSSHLYIVGKQAEGVPLDRLRVVPKGDPLCIAGQSVAGWLAVPMMPLEGGPPSSLQFIPPPGAGKKLNLPGHQVSGAFIVGDLTPGGEVFLTEGVGTAWAAWRATGKPAVVTFGAGRMRTVAQSLRQRDPVCRLVLCPDRGLEHQALEIAREVAGARVALIPESWPKNTDLADLAQLEGVKEVQMVLDAAMPPPHEPHPLAEFVPVDGAVRPPRWVIPGFIAEGVVMAAGEPAVGKTTCLLPLTLVAAHLCAAGNPLRPRHWRHVVFISEDVGQARRVLAGVRDHGSPALDSKLVAERFHLVEAQRLPPDQVCSAGRIYRERFSRHVDGVEVLPLVVMDTRSAVLSLDDENDNSEASLVVAALKQRFEGLPTWIIGHLPKALAGRNEARSLAMRGAGAWEADAHQTMFIVREGEQRFIVLGKRRFDPEWEELAVESWCAEVVVPDEFGAPCTVRLRWGIPRPPEQSRQEAKEKAQEVARKQADAELRQAVRDCVQVAWQGGFPLNKTGVKSKVHRKAEAVLRTVEALLAERWLIEVPIPTNQRSNPKRDSFLVNLTTEEHEEILRGGQTPEEKLVLPASMIKKEDLVRSQSVSSLKEKKGRNERGRKRAPRSVVDSRDDGNGQERTGPNGTEHKESEGSTSSFPGREIRLAQEVLCVIP
jgi:hypothetical protein